MDDVEKKIFDIVAREARMDRENISLGTEVSEIESLDLVQIIFAIEDEFDIAVPQEDDEFKLETLGDVVKGVRDLIDEQRSAAETA